LGITADRGRNAAVVAVLVVVAGVVAYAAVPQLRVYGCRIFGPARAVAVPAPTAPPETVVSIYLDAILANDRGVTHVLSSPEYERRAESYRDAPFCNWTALTGLRVSAARPVSEGYVHVVVRARREQRVGEPGVVDSQGYADWGYFLLKTPDGRWRITSDGLTP
jgi:hypothetical protein